nr:MAG TPA: hypothetical protein [Caudoviricetes sp.]
MLGRISCSRIGSQPMGATNGNIRSRGFRFLGRMARMLSSRCVSFSA